VSVSLSVAELLPGVGSVTPAGVATVAVLVNEPLAAAEILQLAVYVMLPPAGRLAVSLMLPLPLAVHVPPLVPAQVQLQVSEAGNVSATVEPGALLGPAFDAVIVYVTLPPGVAVVTLSVLMIDRSADAPSTSVSVAELLPGVGSVTPAGVATVAVLVNEPLADAEILQLAVYVMLPPAGRLAVSLMLPLPLAVHVPPPAPAQVQLQVSEAGNVSATVEPGALLGPAFDAVIV